MIIQPPEFLAALFNFLFIKTGAPEPKAWAGPQCFDSAAGTVMIAFHIAEATPHRRLS